MDPFEGANCRRVTHFWAFENTNLLRLDGTSEVTLIVALPQDAHVPTAGRGIWDFWIPLQRALGLPELYKQGGSCWEFEEDLWRLSPDCLDPGLAGLTGLLLVLDLHINSCDLLAVLWLVVSACDILFHSSNWALAVSKHWAFAMSQAQFSSLLQWERSCYRPYFIDVG